MSKKDIIKAQQLFNSKDFGILSTLSVQVDGFPFGSVVPYCLDGKGMPIIFISTIAQHTKNIKADNRSSITILRDNDDIQAHGRLCIIGNMELVSSEDEADMARYFRHFPTAKGYSGTHNFSFYRLRPVSIRYIGGFGAIYWFEPADFLIDNPFQGKPEEAIVDHMNKDHQEAMVSYCEHYKQLAITPEDKIQMTSIDSLGFDLFVNKKKVRFDFDEPVTTSTAAREALVSLVKGISK